MGNLNHDYRYITGGDCLEKYAIPTVIGNLYRYCSNTFANVSFNTSKVTNMDYMFQNSSSLITCNLFDTSKVTTMGYMFNGCSKLITVPLFDTSKVTTMSNMFEGCTKLISVPLFDTSKVTTMGYMFRNCNALTTIPQFDMSSVLNLNNMLEVCSNLTSLPMLNLCSATNANIFGSTTMSKLTYLGGFKDLGKVSGFSKPSYFLKNCPNLTNESVLNVINNLYDRATAGYSVIQLSFGATNLAKLSDEEKAIATNKGWTLS